MDSNQKIALALGYGSSIAHYKKIAKETGPTYAESGTVRSDVCGQVCRGSARSTLKISLWLKVGELVEFSYCADHE